jgi:outer membrane protein
MKNISTILSIVSLALIGILFYLFINHTEQIKKITVATEHKSASDFKIAYFDMDSLEAHYDFFKDAQTQANKKQENMNMELSAMAKNDQQKMAEWQKKGNTMTQAESEQAQQEYAAMQRNYESRKETLQQELMQHNEALKASIKHKIEDFLKDYNKQKNFSFIFAYDPNSFMYYKDTLYNVTQDVLAGLNAGYKKKN